MPTPIRTGCKQQVPLFLERWCFPLPHWLLALAGLGMFILFFGWADFIGPFWMHERLAFVINALQLVVILGALSYIIYLIKEGLSSR